MVNRFTDELDALGRIVVAIKAHHGPMSGLPIVVDTLAVEGYLEQHLSALDWAFWQRLQIREQVFVQLTKSRGS